MHIAQEQSHKDCHPQFVILNLFQDLVAKILKQVQHDVKTIKSCELLNRLHRHKIKKPVD